MAPAQDDTRMHMSQVKGHFVPARVPDLFLTPLKYLCGGFATVRARPGGEVYFRGSWMMNYSELDLKSS